MPWIEAELRGQRVLAKARADRSLEIEAGRVEIRYKPKDGRAYRAAASNLMVAPDAKLLPDDTCTSGEPVTREKRSSTRDVTQAAKAPDAPHDAASAASRWIAYTDGACSGNPGPAGSGIVLIAPGGKIHEGYEYLGEGTNNVAELSAILIALELAPKDATSLVVHTDSKYAIGVLQKGWKAKANQELIAKTRAALAKRTGVLLSYVPGHAGVPMNERADELARLAIRTRKSHRVAIEAGEAGEAGKAGKASES